MTISDLKRQIEHTTAQNPHCEQAFDCLEAITLIQLIQSEIQKLKPLLHTNDVVKTLKLHYRMEALRSIHDRINILIPSLNKADPVLHPILQPLFRVHLHQSKIFEEKVPYIEDLERHVGNLLTTHPEFEIRIGMPKPKPETKPKSWFSKFWPNK